MMYRKKSGEPEKKKNSWAKWLSIGGISAIAAVIIALPTIKDGLAYGHNLATGPSDLRALKADTSLAIKTVQGEIDTIQLHEYEDKAWKAKTDERLDNMEKMLTRILDNQERLSHYNPSPKNSGP